MIENALKSRRGFTLVELLIGVVIGGLILVSIYEVLVTQQRTYTAQAAQVQSQNVVRAGLDVLIAELRELSTDGNDILTIGADSFSTRTMRSFGLVCDVDYTVSPTSVTVLKVGDWFEPGDSVWVFSDGKDDDVRWDDVWLPAVATSVDTTQNCVGGNQAMVIPISEVETAANNAPFDTVWSGAPMRAFDRYRYGVYTLTVGSGTDYYLGRQKLPAGPVQYLVGPLRRPSQNGLRFEYYDSLGAVTTDPDAVSQISVTLRTVTAAMGPNGDFIQDSLKAMVYSRN